MKAIAVFPKGKTVKLIDQEEPQIKAPTEVKLRMLEVGVCGTDRDICTFQYGIPPANSSYLVIGHESLAKVVEIGKEVSRVKVGDLVVIMVRRPCPYELCYPCRHDRQDFCITGDFKERGIKEIPQKSEEAQKIRWEQCERILDLVRENILKKNQLTFLMGDFNATYKEPSISTTLEKKGGFIRLLPSNNIGTHLKVELPVDHIFIFPGKYHIKYKCRIYNDRFSASDHNPVIADIKIFDTNTKEYKYQGKGVFQEK